MLTQCLIKDSKSRGRHEERETKDDTKEKDAPDFGWVFFFWFGLFFLKLKLKAQVCCTLVLNAIPSPTLQSTKNGAHASTSAALVHIQFSVDGS